jgi:hypothetical protein
VDKVERVLRMIVKPFDYSVIGVRDRDKFMYWTTTPPTVEGWYWALDVLFQHIEPVYVEWSIPDRKFIVNQMRNGKEMELSDFSHWLGPLPVPEPPNE